MNFGYPPDTPGYIRGRQVELAAALRELIRRPEFQAARGSGPYVEVEGLYRGVRIRRITELTITQRNLLAAEADRVYGEVMGVA